jgi:hypothetical protein
MPLPKDISLARRQLNRLAKAYPEDRGLVTRVDVLRENLRLLGQEPTPQLRRQTEANYSDFEKHVVAKGYTWPPKENEDV